MSKANNNTANCWQDFFQAIWSLHLQNVTWYTSLIDFSIFQQGDGPWILECPLFVLRWLPHVEDFTIVFACIKLELIDHKSEWHSFPRKAGVKCLQTVDSNSKAYFQKQTSTWMFSCFCSKRKQTFFKSTICQKVAIAFILNKSETHVIYPHLILKHFVKNIPTLLPLLEKKQQTQKKNIAYSLHISCSVVINCFSRNIMRYSRLPPPQKKKNQ